MIKSNIDFPIHEIQRDLTLLSKAETNKVLRNATRAGANIVTKKARQKAPEKTGKLSKNIFTGTKRNKKRNEITSGTYIRGINPDTGNSDNSLKKDDPKNAFYGRFVEKGTSKMAAQPFIRPAYDESINQIDNVVNAEIDKGIDNALLKG